MKIYLIGFKKAINLIKEEGIQFLIENPCPQYWINKSNRNIDINEINDIVINSRIKIAKLISALRNYPNHKPSENINKSNYIDIIKKDGYEFTPDYGFETLDIIEVEVDKNILQNLNIKEFEPKEIEGALVSLWMEPLNNTERLYCINCREI